MKVGFIGLTVAAFGILSDAAGKYTVAKVSMITAALLGIYLPGGVPVCHLYNIVHKEELTNGTWWRRKWR